MIQEKIRGHKGVVSSFDQSSELLRAAVKKWLTFLLWHSLRSGLAATPPLFTHLWQQLHPRIGGTPSAARRVTHQTAALYICQPACLSPLPLQNNAAHVTVSQGLAWHLIWAPSSFPSLRAVPSLLKVLEATHFFQWDICRFIKCWNWVNTRNALSWMLFCSFYVPSDYTRGLARLTYLFYCALILLWCWLLLLTFTTKLALLAAYLLKNLVDIVQKSKVWTVRQGNIFLNSCTFHGLSLCKNHSALLIILKYMQQ